MRHWKRVAVTCMTVLGAAVGAGAAGYETPMNRAAKDVLPPAVRRVALTPRRAATPALSTTLTLLWPSALL